MEIRPAESERLLLGASRWALRDERPPSRRWSRHRAGSPNSNGFSFLELMMVVAIISIFAALAVPFLHRAKMTVQEKAALASLRTVSQGEALHCARFQRYGSLDQLVAEKFIDASFQQGSRYGYAFAVPVASVTHFELTAVPSAPGVSGNKAYYVDETGVIRYTEDGSLPTAASPPWR